MATIPNSGGHSLLRKNFDFGTILLRGGCLLYKNILDEAGMDISTSEPIRFKTNVKTYLLLEHIHSDALEWSTTTFKLFDLNGLRRSERVKSQKLNINYSEL